MLKVGCQKWVGDQPWLGLKEDQRLTLVVVEGGLPKIVVLIVITLERALLGPITGCATYLAH